MTTSDEQRARALALLEATHQFPVVYELSVITFSTDEAFASVRAAVEVGLVEALAEGDHVKVPSSGGKYTSHRFRIPCATAEAVLELYARVRVATGVVTVM